MITPDSEGRPEQETTFHEAWSDAARVAAALARRGRGKGIGLRKSIARQAYSSMLKREKPNSELLAKLRKSTEIRQLKISKRLSKTNRLIHRPDQAKKNKTLWDRASAASVRLSVRKPVKQGGYWIHR